MREIKFRVFYEGKMIVPACIGEFGEWYRTGRDYDNGYGHKEGLMQFTGLKDKNGKDVFEGDIIKFGLGDGLDDELGVVRFSKHGFWTSQSDEFYEEILSEELNDLPSEVIGNIYENPELL